MQDRVLAELSKEIDQDRRVDVKRLLDDAERSSRGGLKPKDVRIALLNGLNRSRIDENELDVLIKRYETVGSASRSVDTKKLVDDLQQGRIREPEKDIERTPRSRAEEARILDDVIKNIAAAANRSGGTGAVYSALANEERDGSGTISASSFTSQLARFGLKIT